MCLSICYKGQQIRTTSLPIVTLKHFAEGAPGRQKLTGGKIMSIAIKSAIAGAFAALLIVAMPQAQADGGRWKHEWKHDRFDDHGWRHRHHDNWRSRRHWRDHDRVVVIREPRYVVRERAYVIDEPYYYRSRPSVVIGLPPVVVGF
jgi:hypothetical protein